MVFQSQILYVRRHYHTQRTLLISQPKFYLRLFEGLVLFGLSLIALHTSNAYTHLSVGIPIPDLLLDYLPHLPLDDIYLEGFTFLLGFILILGLHRPYKFPFLLKSIALFTIVRSFFTILTHLSLPLSLEDYNRLYAPTGGLFSWFSSGNDLFFSGHTGLPFLMALLFWQYPILRYSFLFLSVFFGAAVLLAHVHYSIDVFSAFFITYSIYHLACWLFKKDYLFFMTDPLPEDPRSL